MQGKISPKAIAVTQYSVPAHIRDENPELLKFFEYYFQWMSQNGNPMDLLSNLEDYRDVDETTPQFIDLITQQFISFIPATSNVNRVMVASRIKDFYRAKGTLPSYEFLVNLLTGNAGADIEWNSEKVFRPSSNTSTRDASLFTYSNAFWTTACQGAIVEQYYPSEATALIETVTPMVQNNKIINALDIDPETITGEFVPNGLVRVLNNTVNRSWLYTDIYYTEIGVTMLNGAIEDITVGTYSEPARTYPGLILRQVGSNFRAVILSLDSRVIVNNQIQITWTLQNVTGTLGTGDIYLVTAAAEATTYSKGDFQYGTVAPTVSNVLITNGGALNETGKAVTYVGGTGSPFIAKINEIGGGSIDSVDITANGYGYSVGDKLSVDNSNGGNGFSAIVSAVDGQDASLAITLELDAVQIANGGQNYSVGDVFYLTDGEYPVEDMPTTLTVASINSTLALQGINVETGGYGYQYVKIALLDTTSNSLVSPFAATAVLKNGVISAISVTTQPTLTHSTIKVLVNGSGAMASAITGGGAVTSISLSAGGFNYVNPVVTINSTTQPTRLASIKATTNANGTITGFTIVDGGAGYSGTVTVTISEMTGAGAAASAILNNPSTGAVTGLTITNRGTYTKLPTCFNAPYVTIPVNTLYNPLVIQNGQTLTIQNGTSVQIGGSLGTGLQINLKYRIKSAIVGNPGNHYTYVGIDTTSGLGSGAVIVPTIQNGVITGFTFSNHGSGYTTAQVSITSPGGGKGFQGTCVISGGQIASVTIVNGGTGYSNTDTVVFSGNGAGAAASITTANGVVTSMTVLEGGQNYAYDTTLTYVMNPTAYPSAVAGSFTPVVVNGSIASVTINSGGSGYVGGLTNDLMTELAGHILTELGDFLDFDSPYDEPILSSGTPARIGLSMAPHGGLVNVDVIAGGSGYYDRSEFIPLEIYVNSATGSGAVVLPVIENGKLKSYTILHGGSGYKAGDTASVIGGSGSGATITPVIYGGKVVDFIITNPGQNYRYGTSLLVVGDGSGADIDAVVNTSIQQVVIDAAGSGYVSPTITINDVAATVVENPVLHKTSWQGNKQLYNTPRTNLLAFPESATEWAGWGQNNIAVIPNSAITPTGVMAMDMLMITAVSDPYIQQGVNITPYGTYTYSVFVKQGSSAQVELRVPFVWNNIIDRTAVFNFSTGQMTTSFPSSVTPQQPINYGNGVWRIGATFKDTGANNQALIRIKPLNAGGTTTQFDTVYAWGYQFEAGTVMTPYISSPTTFTGRSTTATYFDANGNIQTAAANVARYGADYSSHVSQGLILEPAATNYIQGSQQLDNAGLAYAVWGIFSIGVAPSGTYFAGSIPFFTLTTQTTPNAWWSVWQNLPNANAGDAYTASFATMAGTSNKIQFGLYGYTTGWSVNNISTARIISGPGTLTQNGGGLWTLTNMSNTIPTVVSITRFFPSAEGQGLYFYPDAISLTIGVTNLLTRVQVEKGYVATSYIPTTTGYVTRAADIASSAAYTVTDYTQNVDGSFSFSPTPTGQEGYSVNGMPVIYKNDWQGNQPLSPLPRTNSALYAQRQDNAVWANNQCTATPNSGTAPDGTATANLITASAGATNTYVGQGIPGVNFAGDTMTFSIYIKIGTIAANSPVVLWLRDGAGANVAYSSFNISTGAIVNQYIGGASTVSLGNGWFRWSVSGTFAPNATPGAWIIVDPFNAPVVGETYYLWGAQLEGGSSATSYIPTTSAKVTVTDYVLTNTGKVTFASAPANTAALTWTGSYLDILTQITYNVTASSFGTGNGTQTVFQMLPIGGGSGAILLPVVTNGTISGVRVISGGSHYRNPQLTVSDTYGSGAQLTALVTRNIESVVLNTAGANYVGGDIYISGDGDDAGFALDFEEAGSIYSPVLYAQGTGYTSTPNFALIDTSNKGQVTSVKILNGGAQYIIPPNITLPSKFNGTTQTAGGASFICYGDKVGKVNSVAITQFGADWTEPPLFNFPLSVVLLQNSNFIIGEQITVDRYPYHVAGDVLFDIFTEAGDFLWCEFRLPPLAQEDGLSAILNEDGTRLDAEDVGDLELEFYEIKDSTGTLVPYYDAGPTATVFDVDFSRNILELANVSSPFVLISEDGAELRSEQDMTFVDQYSNGIYIGDTLIGSTSKAEATIKWFNRAAGVHETTGAGVTEKVMTGSIGVLDHSRSKIHDGLKIQDFSYDVKSKAPLVTYESVVKSTVHPAGYKMYSTMMAQSLATGSHTVTVPKTFGIKGASSSFQTKLNEKSGFVNTSALKYTNLMYYIRTLGTWYTTAGSFLGGYTFEQFDPNSTSFITSIPPITALEPWVAPKWTVTANAVIGSNTLSGFSLPAGVSFGYRVIAYDSNGNNIFRDNHLLCEDGTLLLNESSVPGAEVIINQDETMASVVSYGSNSIMTSKYSKITGAVTVVIENIPSLLTWLNTTRTVATPLTINNGQVFTITDGTIVQIT